MPGIRIWSAGREPAGSWNVTDADRAAAPAPADAGGIAICGPVDEPEPNPDSATATPIAPFDREALACLPTPRDSDYHQLTTPKGGAGGGWVELTISNDTHGMQLGLEMPSGKKLSPEERPRQGCRR